MYAVEVENVRKSLGNFQIEDLSFSIEKGRIVGIIGSNGSGKTTIIKLLLNLLFKDSGTIKLLGRDNNENDVFEKIGVYLDNQFPDKLSLEKIDRIMKSIYKNWDSDKFYFLLEKFNLDEDKKFEDYSKGMKTKAALIISMAYSPELLILDEPTSGLDPVVREEILNIFLDYMQDEKNTILMSSHISSDLEKIADYILYIKDGQIIFIEEKDNIIYNFGLIKCGEEDFHNIKDEDKVLFKKNGNNYMILTKDKYASRKKYPDILIDNMNLDDLMLIYS